jgi:signal transduction histidine kinase
VRRETRNLILVTALGLAFGPFIVSAGPFHFSVTPQNAAVNLAFGLIWVAILALTYRRDPAGRLWKVLLLVFVAEGTWVIQFLGGDFTWVLSEFFGPLGAVVMLHLVLAFPTGHLADRFDRWLIGTLYAIVLPIRLLSFLVWDPGWVDCLPTDFCPANPFMIVRNDSLYELLGRVGLASPLFAVVAALETVRHWRRASPAMRRILAPVAFGMPLVFLVQGIWWLAPTLDRDDIRVFMLKNKIFDVPSYLTPTLFLVGTLQIRLARGSLADLAVELGGGVPLGGMRDALARTLRDPTLQLAFAAPSGLGLVDSTGQPFEVPPGPTRATTRVERDGELLALIIHDPAVIREDPSLLEAVGSVARLALENERLQAQVRAQLEEVRASRQRIVEAGDAERRRVERDLHDGAQQRLVALAMRLDEARGVSGDAQTLIDQASTELGLAIDEVRRISRGERPSPASPP